MPIWNGPSMGRYTIHKGDDFENSVADGASCGGIVWAILNP